MYFILLPNTHSRLISASSHPKRAIHHKRIIVRRNKVIQANFYIILENRTNVTDKLLLYGNTCEYYLFNFPAAKSRFFA